jgi:hypothetical protein
MAVRLSALRTGRPLPPLRFLTFILKGSQPHGHSAARRIRSTEKSNDIENRTGDLPVRSIVLPRAPTGPQWLTQSVLHTAHGLEQRDLPLI